MKAHAALADEFGATPWWHGGGSLEWEAEPDRLAQRKNFERLRSWGYAAEWITRREVQELEPDIDPALIGDAPVAFSRKRVGSIRWSTRMPCCPPRGVAMVPQSSAVPLSST
jgi:hypothetical protein